VTNDFTMFVDNNHPGVIYWGGAEAPASLDAHGGYASVITEAQAVELLDRPANPLVGGKWELRRYPEVS
jgi:hypothetical protein